MLTEGGEAQNIVMQSTLPPAFFCNTSKTNEICTLRVETQIAQNSYYYCAGDSSRIIPQLMIQTPIEGSIYKECYIRYSSVNWYLTLTLPVIATLDGVMDGDVTETITVSLTTMINQVDQDTTQLAAIQVDTLLFRHKKWAGYP